jgi:hypothetical protein
MTHQPEVEVLRRIAALVGDAKPPVRYFVSSTRWGNIARELKMDYALAFTDPTNLPNPDNFKEMMIGNGLLVINSGTEDENVVNFVNRAEAERCNFAKKRDNLRVA